MVRYRLRIQLQEYEIVPGETVLGRGSSCNLTIEDPVLSREHAVLRFSQTGETGRITLRDLESRNGTYVNGAEVKGEVELHNGDRIRLGKTEVLFSRVVTPRRDIASTGAIRSCAQCKRPYMMQAPTCPHCGAEGTVAPASRRTDSQQRCEWWLQLEVELLDKALALMRFSEAEESMRRLSAKLAELLDAKKAIEARHLDDALFAAVRLAHSKGTGSWIAWSLDVLHRTKQLPTPKLFALLASTPPILLEEATDALQAVVTDGMHRDLSGADASCLRSLVALLDDVLAFRLRRWDDTSPRALSNALGA